MIKTKSKQKLFVTEAIIIVLGLQLILFINEYHFTEAFSIYPSFKSGTNFMAKATSANTYKYTDLNMVKKKKNKYISNSGSTKLENENLNIEDIISQGIQASESWSMFATPFLNHHDSNIIKSNLNNRGDIKCHEIGAITTSSYSLTTERTRLVMSNPDLEIDQSQLEQDYCSMIKIENIQSAMNIPEATAKSKPWPQLFMQIGIDLENIGEVVIEEETGNCFIVVTPDVAKQVKRLLPKAVRGVGLTVNEVCIGDYMPYDGVHQDMELGILDKRALQYM